MADHRQTLTRRQLFYRTGAAGVSVALGGALLAACGSDDGSDDTVTFAIPGNWKYTDPLKQTFDADFTTRTGLTVQQQVHGTWPIDVVSAVQNQAASGNPPSLAFVGLNEVVSLKDVVVPLDGFINGDEYVAQLDPQFVNLGRIDGQTYLLPLGCVVLHMYYNADAFAKAGLDPNNPPATMSEVAAAAKQIVERGAARSGVIYGWDLDSVWGFESLVRSNAGTMLSADGKHATFHQPPGVAILQQWRDLVAANLMPVVALADGQTMFTRGDVGMYIASGSVIPAVESAAKFQVRVAPFPLPDGGHRVSVVAGNVVVMLARSDAARKKAWTVMREIVSPRGNAIQLEAAAYLPMNRLVTQDPKIATIMADPNRQVGIGAIPSLVPQTVYPGSHVVEISTTLQNALNAGMTGQKTPQQALADAAAKTDQLLAEG
ncbi:extracellular solute-binding protein [Nocardia sp. NPDC004711]